MEVILTNRVLPLRKLIRQVWRLLFRLDYMSVLKMYLGRIVSMGVRCPVVEL